MGIVSSSSRPAGSRRFVYMSVRSVQLLAVWPAFDNVAW